MVVGRIAGMTFESSADLDAVGLGRERRSQMCAGLPMEYHDALMDDDYMKDLVLSVEKQAKKRRTQMDRYIKMNQTILIALIIQAAFGVFLALWMTVLQPQYSYKSDLNLEDVDMVIMMDASGHLGTKTERPQQIEAVKSFTKSLYDAMSTTTSTKMESTMKSLLDEKYKHLTWLQNLWTPSLDYEDESQQKWARDNIYRSRGYLRIATSLFNANFYNPASAHSGFPGLLHNLSYSQDAQIAALDKLNEAFGDEDPYIGHSQWYTAMRQCYDIMKDATMKGQALEVEDPLLNKRMGYRCWKPQPGKDEKECKAYKAEEECPKRYCAWASDGKADSKAGVCQEKPPLCRRQYCIIIGDSDAMCNRHGEHFSKKATWAEKTKALCEKAKQKDPNTKLCPPEDDKKVFGTPFEWSAEMDQCRALYEDTMITDEAAAEKNGVWDVSQLNQDEDVKLIMMFLVGNERERQLRLGNPTLKGFIDKTLKCKVHANTSTWENPTTGIRRSYQTYSLDDSCTQFMLALSFEELAQQAQRVAELLKADATVAASPNASKDLRYLFFLILPLNLFFYLGWTYLIRLYTTAQTHMDKLQGKKKKMIKVTKNLIEKVEEPIGNALPAEMELAEVEKLKVPVEFGGAVTLRGRLKGGYMRNNEAKGECDGNGKAFDPTAFFSFEPADDSGMTHYPIDSGMPFRIKNNKGEFLQITEDGTRWASEPDPNGSCDFSMEQFNLDEATMEDAENRVNLGDTALIRCNATGKFLKISKDGVIDGVGERTQPECQIVVDSGGLPMTTGAICTIATDAAHLPLHCTPQGGLRVGLEGDEECYGGCAGEWVHWLLEKKGHGGHHNDALSAALASAGGIGMKSLAPPGQPHADKMSDAGSDAGGSMASGLSESEGIEVTANFSMAKDTAPMVRKMSTQADPRMNHDILREGDIIQIKAANGQYLEVEADGVSMNAGKAALGGSGSSATVLTREFVVHKLGVSRITKHNQIIRRGEKVCLRPHLPTGDKMDNHMKVNDNEDGVEASGTLFDKEIAFIFDISGIMNCVDPLSSALHRGDCEVMYSPLWDKKKIERVEAMSAAWCDDSDLAKVQGIVVVASGTSYTVPKGKQPWVAVIEDGVDVYKAAAQVKAQGATGLIIRCDNPCEMERLALGADRSKNAPPVLPAVFCSKTAAEGLNEKGLVLKGCEFRKKYVTDVMRAIGRAPQNKGKVANTDVFNAAARAMLEREKELKIWKQKEEERKQMEAARAVEDEDGEGGGDKFKWKVNTNTHYLWGGKGKMKVDYGKKAPPSAHKDKKKFDAHGNEIHHVDAANHRSSVHRPSLQKTMIKKTRMSVTVVDAADFQNKDKSKLKLEGFSEMMVTEEADLEDMEELSEDSDFKIDYKFEEIEVDVDAKPEELEEGEEIMEEGQEIVKVGVPKKKFWMVAVGLAISTLVLLIILIVVLTKKPKEEPKPTDQEATKDVYGMADLHATFDNWIVGERAVALNQALEAQRAPPAMSKPRTVAEAVSQDRTMVV